ncbi:MTH1187 family thiamine-binding protein [Desulfolithobacter sp.]
MALMQITIIPLGTGTPSVGDYVADVVQVLEDKEIPYVLNDMGTVIEGEVNELLGLASMLHELPFISGVERVITQIVLDDRRDVQRTLGDKPLAVRRRLKERSK